MIQDPLGRSKSLETVSVCGIGINCERLLFMCDNNDTTGSPKSPKMLMFVTEKKRKKISDIIRLIVYIVLHPFVSQNNECCQAYDVTVLLGIFWETKFYETRVPNVSSFLGYRL